MISLRPPSKIHPMPGFQTTDISLALIRDPVYPQQTRLASNLALYMSSWLSPCFLFPLLLSLPLVVDSLSPPSSIRIKHIQPTKDHLRLQKHHQPNTLHSAHCPLFSQREASVATRIHVLHSLITYVSKKCICGFLSLSLTHTHSLGTGTYTVSSSLMNLALAPFTNLLPRLFPKTETHTFPRRRRS